MPRCPVPLARHSALQVGVLGGSRSAAARKKPLERGSDLKLGRLGPITSKTGDESASLGVTARDAILSGPCEHRRLSDREEEL